MLQSGKIFSSLPICTIKTFRAKKERPTVQQGVLCPNSKAMPAIIKATAT
jgi:hypothetical protein